MRRHPPSKFTAVVAAIRNARRVARDSGTRRGARRSLPRASAPVNLPKGRGGAPPQRKSAAPPSLDRLPIDPVAQAAQFRHFEPCPICTGTISDEDIAIAPRADGVHAGMKCPHCGYRQVKILPYKWLQGAAHE